MDRRESMRMTQSGENTELLALHTEDTGARGDEPRRLNLTETASRSILNAGFHVSLFFIVFYFIFICQQNLS